MSSAAAVRKPASAAESDALADDPVWQSFLQAPMGEAETEEQRRLTEEARRGPFASGAAMSAEIAARCPPGK